MHPFHPLLLLLTLLAACGARGSGIASIADARDAVIGTWRAHEVCRDPKDPRFGQVIRRLGYEFQAGGTVRLSIKDFGAKATRRSDHPFEVFEERRPDGTFILAGVQIVGCDAPSRLTVVSRKQMLGARGLELWRGPVLD